MDKSIEIWNLPKRIKEEVEIFNSLIIMKLNQESKDSQQTEVQDEVTSQMNST